MAGMRRVNGERATVTQKRALQLHLTPRWGRRKGVRSCVKRLRGEVVVLRRRLCARMRQMRRRILTGRSRGGLNRGREKKVRRRRPARVKKR